MKYNLLIGMMEASKKVDDYLTDNDVSPKPIAKLVSSSHILASSLYFEQLIECAPYWTPDARLAVGSIIVEQPLKAQGAVDVHFIYSDKQPLGDIEDEQRPVFYKPLGSTQDGFICLEIHGDWNPHGKWNADVNGTAKNALMRMQARELKLEDQWPHLYQFVREVASYGLNVDLNRLIHNEDSPATIRNEISRKERELGNKAVSALNKFEGRDEEQSKLMRGLPSNDEVRSASHLGVRGDE